MKYINDTIIYLAHLNSPQAAILQLTITLIYTIFYSKRWYFCWNLSRRLLCFDSRYWGRVDITSYHWDKFTSFTFWEARGTWTEKNTISTNEVHFKLKTYSPYHIWLQIYFQLLSKRHFRLCRSLGIKMCKTLYN